MKTWEVIKALTENPNLKFEYDTGFEAGVVTMVRGYVKVIECSKLPIETPTVLDLNIGFMTADWQLVQEPVDFMTAANSGKRISSEGWDSYYFLHEVLHILQNRDNALYLINGKWLIED